MGDATARLSRPFRPAGVGLRRKRTFDQRLGDFAGEAALGVFESAMATTMGLTKIAQAGTITPEMEPLMRFMPASLAMRLLAQELDPILQRGRDASHELTTGSTSGTIGRVTGRIGGDIAQIVGSGGVALAAGRTGSAAAARLGASAGLATRAGRIAAGTARSAPLAATQASAGQEESAIGGIADISEMFGVENRLTNAMQSIAEDPLQRVFAETALDVALGGIVESIGPVVRRGRALRRLNRRRRSLGRGPDATITRTGSEPAVGQPMNRSQELRQRLGGRADLRPTPPRRLSTLAEAEDNLRSGAGRERLSARDTASRSGTPAPTPREAVEAPMQAARDQPAEAVARMMKDIDDPVERARRGMGQAGGVTNDLMEILAGGALSVTAGLIAGAATEDSPVTAGTTTALATAGILLGVRNAGLRRQLTQALTDQRHAERLAGIDELTGLGSTGAWRRALPAAEEDAGVAVMMFDVGNLKAMNDLVSFQSGDALIARASVAVREAADQVGMGERVFRAGGDEIGVLVPAEQADDLAARALAAFGKERVPGTDFENFLRAGLGQTLRDADDALRAAKASETGQKFRNLTGEIGQEGTRAALGAAGGTLAALGTGDEVKAAGLGSLALTVPRSVARLNPKRVITHDLAPGMLEAVPQRLRSTAPLPVIQGKRAGQRVRENLEQVEQLHPNPLKGPDEWRATQSQATGSDAVLRAPHQAMAWANDPDLLVTQLRRLTQEQADAVNEGMDFARTIRQQYVSGQAQPVKTGLLSLWSFLSRKASPFPQEALYLSVSDSPELRRFIGLALEGNYTKETAREFSAWKDVATAPGNPGRSAIDNLNAFGGTPKGKEGVSFLFKMGQLDPESGLSRLARLHQMLAEDAPTKDIRRWFLTLEDAATGDPVKTGMQAKLLDFMLLAAGREDVLIIDRIASRSLWDAKRLGFDPFSDGGLSKHMIKTGSVGLQVYEAIERGLRPAVKEAYRRMGREGDLSRFHWENWIIEQGSLENHASLRAFAQNPEASIARGVRAEESRFGTFSFGAQFFRDAEGLDKIAFASRNGEIVMDAQVFSEAMSAGPLRKAGVIPTGFKVSQSGNRPWWDRPNVNRSKLDDWLESQPGARRVRPGAGGASPLERPGSIPDGGGGPGRSGGGAGDPGIGGDTGGFAARELITTLGAGAVGSVAATAAAPEELDPVAGLLGFALGAGVGARQAARQAGRGTVAQDIAESSAEELRANPGRIPTAIRQASQGVSAPVPGRVQFGKFGLDSQGQRELEATVAGMGNLRRTVTFEEVEKAATRMGMTDIRQADLNDQVDGVTLLAIRQNYQANNGLLKQAQKQLDELTSTAPKDPRGALRRVLSPEARTVQEWSLTQEINRLTRTNEALLRIFIPRASDAGRTLNSLKILARQNLDDAWPWLVKAQRIAARDLTSEERVIIERFVAQKDAQGLISFVRGLEVPTKLFSLEGINIVRRAGLLLGLRTQSRNFLSNTAEQTFQSMDNPAAVFGDRIASWVVAQATGGRITNSRTQVLRTMGDRIKAGRLGAVRGLEKMQQVMRGLEVDEGTLRRLDLRHEASIDNKFFDSYVKFMFRLQGAADQPFRQVAYMSSMIEQARVLGTARGLRGAELEKFIDDLIKKPGDDIAMQAALDSEEAVFQNKSAIGSGVSAFKRVFREAGKGQDLGAATARGLSAVLDFVVPFSSTPSSIIGRLMERTPIGLASSMVGLGQLWSAARGGASTAQITRLQRQITRRFGRAATGSVAILYGYDLAKDGLMSGRWPEDQEEARIWMQEGKSEDSILINGRWRRLNGLSPVGNLMALGAQSYHDNVNREAEGQAGTISLGGRAGQLTSNFMLGSLKTVKEQSFLRGVNDMLAAIDNDRGMAERFALNSVRSFVPTALGDVARFMDPVMRDPQNFPEAFLSKVPFTSFQVPARLDVFGRPRVDDGSTETILGVPVPERGLRLIDPFLSTTDKRIDDPIIRELSRVGAGVSRPSQLEGEDALAYNERRAFEGQNEILAITTVMENALYRQLGVEDQRDVLKDVITAVRRQLRDNGRVPNTWRVITTQVVNRARLRARTR